MELSASKKMDDVIEKILEKISLKEFKSKYSNEKEKIYTQILNKLFFKFSDIIFYLKDLVK